MLQDKSKSDWDESIIVPSGEYQEEKNTFRTILGHHKELQNLPFKNNETNFADFTEIKYSIDETLHIKEENIEVEAIAGQEYFREYEAKLCNAGIKETDNSTDNSKLLTHEKNNIQKSEQEPEKKYKCKKCARSYNWKRNLHLHQKFECGVRPRFRCKFCGKRFPLKSIMYRHKCFQSYSLLRDLSRRKYLKHAAVIQESTTAHISPGNSSGAKTLIKYDLDDTLEIKEELIEDPVAITVNKQNKSNESTFCTVYIKEDDILEINIIPRKNQRNQQKGYMVDRILLLEFILKIILMPIL
ncbi:zinc finger protein 354A-like [Belonocnema kinseyi]|uniref:zinc finger protein 354A-like n=1 Tax=Belonocnema kinseyi TaxID=2817044 RepID=UPI00143DFC80|nr:zinc finger protein 354A-like [Belonocnema kinseyi]